MLCTKFINRWAAVSAQVSIVVFFMTLSLVSLSMAQSVNILPNPSFEESKDNKPVGWREYRFGGRGNYEYANTGRTGEKSVMISSDNGADLSWGAIVIVRPYAQYRFTGWIKTENLAAATGRGALFNLHGINGAETPAVTGTTDWTQVEMVFDTDNIDAVQINCLFGGFGRATGTAWFDDVSLELISAREIEPSITINASKTGEPISKYIYGQFIEHLGRCIYGGIWAEMLEDRKFYYSLDDRQTPWQVVGDPESVSMIQENSFVGEQTPQVTLKGDGSAAGLKQEELGLKQGMVYEGNIVLSGDPSSAPIEISLLSQSTDAKKRETVKITDIDTEYNTYPLRFTEPLATNQGVLEIISKGSGAFRIGTVSLMPADNIEGFRADVLALLRELDAPVYRWPGGNFVSGYDWKDGIGDRDKRPPRKNPAWRGVEHNDVGIHEFIALCRLIDTEPYVTVNTGLGTVDAAAQEVEYCNGALDTPMGKMRAENGNPEPFNVIWWAIGNEMYGNWQLGNIPVDDYIKKHNAVVEAMRAVDPDIKVVAVGSVGRWDRSVLAGSADHMDLISEHFYCQERPGLMAHIAQVPGHIRRISTAIREYHDTIPALSGKNIPIAMDEWNYWYGPHVYGELGTRYFLKDALGIAAGLHEYYLNSDIVFMANYAQTVNVIGCIKTTKTDAAFATTGLVLKLYRHHFGTIPVEVGGAPEPMYVSAALKDDGNTLTVSIVNPTREEHDLPFDLEGAAFSGNGTVWLITGENEMLYNEPGLEPRVIIQEKSVEQLSDVFNVPPISISLFELPVKN